MSARGFGRAVEAVKGCARLFEYLSTAGDNAAEAHAAGAAAEHLAEGVAGACKRRQVEGWRCTVRGKHRQCLLEKVP
jgi:hypothetical protein